ncbi:MAG: hypothetical protein R3E39_31455 [Anaerolineae bacterium]
MTRLLWIALLLIPLTGTASAQDSTAPLLYIQHGYIYAWTQTNGIRQLSAEQYASDLALAPDGSTFAFIQQSREYPGTGGFEIGDPLQTSHICLWNGGTPRCITRETDAITLRRFLQWQSNNQLTWIEYAFTDTEQTRGASLVVYDLASGQSRHSDSLPLTTGDAGNYGFYDYALFRDAVYVGCCSGTPSIRLYDPQTCEQVFQTYIPETIYEPASSKPVATFVDVVLAADEAQTDEIYLLYCNGQWQQVDMEHSVWDNAITTTPAATPYFGLAADVPSANRLRVHSYTCDSASSQRAVWTIEAPDGTVLDALSFPYFSDKMWQLSPDGSQIAYLTDEGITVWSEGSTQLLAGTQSASEIIWSRVGWHVPPEN